MSASELKKRIHQLAADGNLDVEDVELALREAGRDGLDEAEQLALREALGALAAKVEPGARQYLEDRLAGRAVRLVSRVLLGPVPAGERADRYQPRSEVIRVQDALREEGADLRADGDYGPRTTAAVRDLQARLEVPATGWIDGETLLRWNAARIAAGRLPLDLNPRARIRPDVVLAMKHGTNLEDNRVVQAALSELAAPLGEPALALTVDGAFGARTEAAVAALQRRAYLPETGIVDGATLDALNAARADVGLPPITLRGAAHGPRVELHFYPGDHELKVYVLRGGRLLDTYGMVGGQNRFVDDPGSDVDYSPTPEGRFEVIELNPHASVSWPYSYVPYGSDLREQEGEIAFRDRDGVWKLATGPSGVFAGRRPAPLDRSAYFGPEGVLPPFWTANDFGHLRGRIRSLRTRNVLTHMIHPSPDQEQTANYFADTSALTDPATALRVLRHSHGCAHVHPRDVDEMVAKGYLATGTIFEVHGYDESYG